jgi:phospholipid-binding lipoprotein MlaA
VWVKEAGVIIPFRLPVFCLLGVAMMLATGCAGKTGTVQPQGLNDERPVVAQAPASAPVEYDPWEPYLALPQEASNARPVVAQTPVPAPSPPPKTQSDEPFDPFARVEEGASEEYDPWEPVNTNVFEFNRQVDRFILKPVAKGYNFVVPDLVQVGVSNIFTNLRFAPRFLNNVFQGKLKGAGIEAGRFLINSTVGLAGFFDPAKHIDLVTPEEDLGQTLGFYGVKPGPYLVLPLLPPFTVRDFVGYVGDVFLNPINWLVAPLIEVKNVPSVIAHKNRTTTTFIQSGSRVGEVINERSRNLEKFQGVEEATLDLYTAVRNAYLQKRAQAIGE